MPCACAVLSSVACLAVSYFSTLSYKRKCFKKKMFLNIKCVFWFSVNCCFFSLCKKNWARHDQICILVFTYSTRRSCQILIKLNFLNTLSRNTQILDFRKIRPVGADLFHVDGQRDGQTGWQIYLTKLLVAFRSFTKGSKTWHSTFLIEHFAPHRDSIRGS